MFGIKEISRWQFALLRIGLGVYLLVHFATLLPYAGELFSSAGTLSDPSLSPLYHLLPSPLWVSDTPAVASAMITVALFAALALMIGWRRKMAAAVLLYVWACLFCRNPLIANPSLAYVGLILLLSLLIPAQEPVRPGKTDPKQWVYPSGVYWTAWILLAAGYTFSGIIKLQSPSWIDGTALIHLAENPLARPGFLRDALLFFPTPVLKLLTWLSLAGEILFLPLSFFGRGRLAMWALMLGMHLGILMVVDFMDLTAAMLLMHFFVFDPDWLPARKKNKERIFFYDGDCGLCTHSVQFFMEEDRSRLLRFAPLQGETARCYLPEGLRDPEQLSTVVLYERHFGTNQETILTRSRAICTALVEIGGFWRIPGQIGLLIPGPLRDIAYGFIARNRHKLFPKRACALPTAEEREHLLS